MIPKEFEALYLPIQARNLEPFGTTTANKQKTPNRSFSAGHHINPYFSGSRYEKYQIIPNHPLNHGLEGGQFKSKLLLYLFEFKLVKITNHTRIWTSST
jgi:hypothetical protein